MASLRRNRTMPTDGAIAKFLYTILKQLDLKSIDWQEVADGLDITNGHAARMRFSRFKQQMEGVPSTSRKPKPAVPRQKKAKPSKPAIAEKRPKEEQQSEVYGEAGMNTEVAIKGECGEKPELVVKAELEQGIEPMQGIQLTLKPEPVVKEEPKDDEEVLCLATEDIGDGESPKSLRSISPGEHGPCSESLESTEDCTALKVFAPNDEDPIVKPEPFWEN